MARAGFFLAVATAAMVLALILAPGSLLAEGPPRYEASDLIVLAFAVAAGFAAAGLAWRNSHVGYITAWEAVAIAGMVAAALALAVLMAAEPGTFNTILREDQFGEWVSAALLFAGATAAAIALARKNASLLERLLLLALALVALLIGLEEVSWFQRWLGYATPQWVLDRNWQGEFNFHNMWTSLSELVYYVGTALVFVGGRVLLALPERPAFVAHFRRYAPAAPALVAGCLSCAFNWDLWQVVLIEASFALAVGVLLIEAILAWRIGRTGTAALFGFALAATIAVQAMFLLWGYRMPRYWASTEARELFIAAAIAFYALQFALPARAKSDAQAFQA